MPDTTTITEYKTQLQDLSEIEPLQICCSSPMETVQVEPLEGRNTLEVERSCIVRCPDCGRSYRSRWD